MGFYDDLEALGGLGSALRGKLKELGSPLAACAWVVDGRTDAVLAEKGRSAEVRIALDQRLFLVDFWERGFLPCRGASPDLEGVAKAAHAWVAERASSEGLVRPFPFVQRADLADAVESGDAREFVRKKWEALPKHMPAMAGFIAAAARHPVLGALYPYQSVMRLCFSRCTHFPFSGDCPVVWPGEGGAYVVRDRQGNLLGQGDAEEAVRAVAAHLPPGCGPAIMGNQEDLAERGR